ncbi:uncharacterized protein J3D65DRAFT_425762 [Phyllosticta citribraziliensis]|uniref:Uncharacterized protein n=1 Tax=Phyllosticta citribraziliensis TaxID=989973 RepID=A0ABR1LI08_9PEZI
MAGRDAAGGATRSVASRCAALLAADQTDVVRWSCMTGQRGKFEFWPRAAPCGLTRRASGPGGDPLTTDNRINNNPSRDNERLGSNGGGSPGPVAQRSVGSVYRRALSRRRRAAYGRPAPRVPETALGPKRYLQFRVAGLRRLLHIDIPPTAHHRRPILPRPELECFMVVRTKRSPVAQCGSAAKRPPFLHLLLAPCSWLASCSAQLALPLAMTMTKPAPATSMAVMCGRNNIEEAIHGINGAVAAARTTAAPTVDKAESESESGPGPRPGPGPLPGPAVLAARHTLRYPSCIRRLVALSLIVHCHSRRQNKASSRCCCCCWPANLLQHASAFLPLSNSSTFLRISFPHSTPASLRPSLSTVHPDSAGH